MKKPKQANLMFRLMTATGFLLASFAGLGSDASTHKIRPNILFIALDDLNDWIGYMGGHPQTLTPNLDRLAAKSMLFRNAHCPAPACNPCRSAQAIIPLVKAKSID